MSGRQAREARRRNAVFRECDKEYAIFAKREPEYRHRCIGMVMSVKGYLSYFDALDTLDAPTPSTQGPK